MEPTTTPGNQTSEWRATLIALLSVPGLGAALVVFKDALLSRPWPFVALAGIGALVAVLYGWQRTWLKAQLARVTPAPGVTTNIGVGGAPEQIHAALADALEKMAKVPPAAVVLALLLVPSLALADCFPGAMRAFDEIQYAPYLIAGLWTGTFITARCWRSVRAAVERVATYRRRASWSSAGPMAALLALLSVWMAVPSIALASEGVKTGGVSFAHAFVLLLGVPALLFLLVVLGVSGLAVVRRARCLTWLACALVLLVPSVARADDPPPAAARAQAPALLPAAPAPEAPSVAQEAAANAVPPVACPEPCEACGRKLGGTAAAVGLPTWSKWLVGIGAGLTFAATVAERGHAVGLW